MKRRSVYVVEWKRSSGWIPLRPYVEYASAQLEKRKCENERPLNEFRVVRYNAQASGTGERK